MKYTNTHNQNTNTNIQKLRTVTWMRFFLAE